ncbi:MAG TPA: HigA family addiction module antitoxin [Candidatus Sumerlaeota bacterium]|nr:HigA family addiction module antitoxin [Candidatus Sumerlaeota bacterium]
MMTETIHSDLAIPPGEYLEEVLENLGMSKDELARRMGRPASKLSEIYKGAKAITPETALQLERVLGVPAHIWSGLESEYRLVLARQEEAKRTEQLREEVAFVPKFCYRELVQANEVPQSRSPLEKVRILQEFFGVMSLKTVLKSQRYQAAFRCGRSGERSSEAVAAWLRLGERRAQSQYCAPFDKRKLLNALEDLRAMTLKAPAEFQKPLQESLSECGVALVICPHFQKTYTHGATFWLGREKAVIMLTIRGKWADIFWFSLFHEIGHILLDDCQSVILEDGGESKREEKADRFAADTLIAPEAYEEFLRANRFYEEDILSFARIQKIHPGVVVGRLQHEHEIDQRWHNDLRARYEMENAQFVP